MGRIVDLPSGAKLEITVAPFSPAKTLYKTIAEELKTLKIDPNAELDFRSKKVDVTFYKDILCTLISSNKIETALNECLKRTTYNGLKITEETWEPETAREDYLIACFEVVVDNVSPFLKGLSRKYAILIAEIIKSQA